MFRWVTARALTSPRVLDQASCCTPRSTPCSQLRIMLLAPFERWHRSSESHVQYRAIHNGISLVEAPMSGARTRNIAPCLIHAALRNSSPENRRRAPFTHSNPSQPPERPISRCDHSQRVHAAQGTTLSAFTNNEG